MASLQSVWVNSLWVLGVSGVLATGSYMQWHRTARHWSWRFVVRTPRFLFPLCLNIILICAGVALNGRFGVQPDAWWQGFIWVGFTLLFASQSVLVAVAGHNHGWDTAMEGK